MATFVNSVVLKFFVDVLGHTEVFVVLYLTVNSNMKSQLWARTARVGVC